MCLSPINGQLNRLHFWNGTGAATPSKNVFFKNFLESYSNLSYFSLANFHLYLSSASSHQSTQLLSYIIVRPVHEWSLAQLNNSVVIRSIITLSSTSRTTSDAIYRVSAVITFVFVRTSLHSSFLQITSLWVDLYYHSHFFFSISFCKSFQLRIAALYSSRRAIFAQFNYYILTDSLNHLTLSSWRRTLLRLSKITVK